MAAGASDRLGGLKRLAFVRSSVVRCLMVALLLVHEQCKLRERVLMSGMLCSELLLRQEELFLQQLLLLQLLLLLLQLHLLLLLLKEEVGLLLLLRLVKLQFMLLFELNCSEDGRREAGDRNPWAA
jgi:hypothetical protein